MALPCRSNWVLIFWVLQSMMAQSGVRSPSACQVRHICPIVIPQRQTMFPACMSPPPAARASPRCSTVSFHRTLLPSRPHLHSNARVKHGSYVKEARVSYNLLVSSSYKQRTLKACVSTLSPRITFPPAAYGILYYVRDRLPCRPTGTATHSTECT